MNEELRARIETMTHSFKVFLFMKGTPDEPQCGFSKKVVDTLNELKITFKSFDIFTDEEIRQGVKEYANWPTIPQLYIDGEFIGGCDIVEQLVRTGELQRLAVQ